MTLGQYNALVRGRNALNSQTAQGTEVPKPQKGSSADLFALERLA
jgi:hypothetical protein